MTSALPENVPADRVVDFDIYFPPQVEDDYHSAWLKLRSPDRSLVWTASNGGHWIATGGPEIRELWADAGRMSNDVLAVPRGLGHVMRFIPLQQDPPEHTPFRNAVMRGFASRFIVALEPQVIENARALIAELAPSGRCDFASDFAEVLPVEIFLTLIDVPREHRPMLRELGAQLTRPDGSMTVEQLRQAADDFLAPYVETRLLDPQEDLLSRILACPIEGRPWTLDEARRMCRNILFGGLDTVAAMMGFIMLHLARSPDDQQALRSDPSLIPDAVDELMRRYASVSVSRDCREDVEIDGVTLRKGDIVYLPSVLHNLDPASFDEPEAVRFDRKLNPAKHSTMGSGPHRCVGAGLARMEIIAVVREWLQQIPTFSVARGQDVKMKGGNVGACVSIPLEWHA